MNWEIYVMVLGFFLGFLSGYGWGYGSALNRIVKQSLRLEEMDYKELDGVDD